MKKNMIVMVYSLTGYIFYLYQNQEVFAY